MQVGYRTQLLGVGALSFLVFWLAARTYDAGRGDFFYLADAFLHGRAWLETPLGEFDTILRGGHVYVPFAPFPAILLVPLVAITGPGLADQLEPGINASLAALGMVLAWHLATRIGVRRNLDRVWLVVLLGLSTPILWVTTRGGVWHTGHLVAVMLTLGILIELFGRRRPLLIGLMVGAAFLSRAPIAFALPACALWYLPQDDPVVGRARGVKVWITRLPWRSWVALAAGFAPALLFFAWYNLVRFGSVLESGYAIASVMGFLEDLRAKGLFSLAHVPMNIDYLFLHLPTPIAAFPGFRPDGLGMSILLTSPGLLLAVRAPWRDRRSLVLLLAAGLVLVPTLLYYGGGWLQFGYRYALDSIPWVWALAAMAAARVNRLAMGWKLLIAFGVLVNAAGIYWAHNI